MTNAARIRRISRKQVMTETEALVLADHIISTWDNLNPAFSMRELLADEIIAAYRQGIEEARREAQLWWGLNGPAIAEKIRALAPPQEGS